MGTVSLAAGCLGALLLVAFTALTGQTWMASYLCAWLFVLGISLGSLALESVHILTGGAWGHAARPFLHAAIRILPICALLAVPLLFRLPELYPWMHSASAVAAPGPSMPGASMQPSMTWYLTTPSFLVRAALYFAIWLTLARLLLADRPLGAHSAQHQGQARRQGLASVGFVLYALTTTFAAVDWMMSLTPRWHSTGFGLLIGVAQVLSAVCGAIIGATLLCARVDEERRLQFHDLGKLLFALVLLWAYLAFMQFLIIWIEDLPDEIGWYLPRVQTSWSALTWFVALVQFALPFLALLSSGLKRRPPALAALAAVVLLGCLADTYWLVLPSLRPRGFTLTWNDLFGLLAVGGLWFGFLLRTMRTPAAESLRAEENGGMADHAAAQA